MNKNITLVILAAGMGSRFGGLKQVTPVGPVGQFIIDYSVFDAVRAGFNKIVFLIKKENYELFKETIGKRVENHVKVEYVFQELDNLPEGYLLPSERTKPLGTAHALLCCKKFINEPFAMINADDFYGRDAFLKAFNFLKKTDISSYDSGLIGYKLKDTLSENGSVKRAICQVNSDDYLTSLTESYVESIDGEIVATPLNKNDSFTAEEGSIASMNFLLFTPKIFGLIEELFPNFFKENKDSILTAEFLVPDLLEKLINQKKLSVKVIRTTACWQGMTYKEDLPYVKRSIQKMINDGEYNYSLWN